MKKDFIKIWGLAAIVASLTIFVFTMINIYITGQDHDIPHRQIVSTYQHSTDAFIEKLQKQNLWINLQETDEQQKLVVPPIAYKYIPKTLPKIENAPLLKNAFISVLLPLALIANAEIENEKLFIAYIQNKEIPLNRRDKLAWEKILQRYKCKDGDFACLNLKVQPIPVALTVSQAALESGWGTSRFVRQGNALFGQWTNEKSDQYIEAEESPIDNPVRLRAFGNLLSSVRSYMLNLNTHRAYKDFRKQRLTYMGGNATFENVVKTLERYAEKKKYSDLVFSIINENNLLQLNFATLDDEINYGSQ